MIFLKKVLLLLQRLLHQSHTKKQPRRNYTNYTSVFPVIERLGLDRGQEVRDQAWFNRKNDLLNEFVGITKT